MGGEQNGYSNGSKRVVISRDTLVPISLIVGMAIVIFSLASSFVWLKTSLYAIETKITSVESKLDNVVRENVNNKDLRLWIKSLKAQNPSLQVPDLEN